MYSQCPDCQTRFRVTAEALRTARGTVRCGRCGTAFDALARLSDTIPPVVREPVSAPFALIGDADAVQVAASATEYHFSAEDLERVFIDARDWPGRHPLVPPAPVGDGEPGDGETAEPVVVQEGAVVEDITLEGENASDSPAAAHRAEANDRDSTDEVEILDYVPDSAYPDEDEVAPIRPAVNSMEASLETALEPQPSEVAGSSEPPLFPQEKPGEPEPPPADSRVQHEPAPLSAQRWRPPAEELLPEPAAETSARRTIAWTAGSLALALVLVVQLVNYYRQDLVRHPQLGPPLRAAYARTGVPLLPNWDLAALELRQWGNEANAAADGRMVVRASLTNRARFAQPHPILRLELEDRYGATVASRDFEPADYLKNPSQASRLLAPGATTEAELLLADPGREAVGYRLDVCLRESERLLRCATGPG